MDKFCAFDIEIVKEFPKEYSWKQIRPLGISCAATICTGDTRPTFWFHGKYGNEPLEGAMTVDEVSELVEYLQTMEALGYKIVTWNGLGFDFDILAEESDKFQQCKDLAMNHIDMMFHLFCVKGFPLGLNTAAHGLGLPGKTEGMHGDLAPIMWAKSVEDRHKVLEYVGQDVITTLQVCETALQRNSLQWTSKTGRQNFVFLPDGWLPVCEAIKLSLPDTSWMSNPKTRDDFTSWTLNMIRGS